MNIFTQLPKPFFTLAPLDDVSDIAFRSVVADCARPDLFFTEFVNVDGLQSPGRNRLIHKLKIADSDHPIIAQIWGKNPDNYRKTASELVDMGFAGVDINMGCPDKTIIKNGCCIALINDRPLAQEIIKATKEGVNGRLPVSVKTRLGWDEIDFSWPQLLLEQGLDALTIHGRTKKQLSLVPANWEAIGHVRELRDKTSPETLIIGNGDVDSLSMGRELAAKYSLDGIMIGRGIFSDPFVFSDNSPWDNYTPEQKKQLYAKHIELFARNYQKNERNVNTLRKFCKVYINNFDGAKELREALMKVNTTTELLALLK